MKTSVKKELTGISSKRYNGKIEFKKEENDFFTQLTAPLPSYGFTTDDDDEPIESQLKKKILFLNDETSSVYNLLHSSEELPHKRLIYEWHPFFNSHPELQKPIKRLPREKIREGNDYLDFKKDDSFFDDLKNKSIIGAMAQSKALRRYELELDELINQINNDILGLQGTSNKKPPPKYGIAKAFNWIGLPKAEQLNWLYEKLSIKFIDCSDTNFVKAFAGGVIDKPLNIKWRVESKNKSTSKSTLFLFLDLLKAKKLIKEWGNDQREFYRSIKEIFTDVEGKQLEHLKNSYNAYLKSKDPALSVELREIVDKLLKAFPPNDSLTHIA